MPDFCVFVQGVWFGAFVQGYWLCICVFVQGGFGFVHLCRDSSFVPLCKDSGFVHLCKDSSLCICARILACVYLCKGGLSLERDPAETEQGLSGGALEERRRQTRTEKLYFCVLQYT